jgi:hypothetical protein
MTYSAVQKDADWAGPHEGRECGDCYACCVHLGIDELKKYPGQTCKHLDGGLGACTRCSIYAKRPAACAKYRCFWRQGGGPDWLRPADAGVLITLYQEPTITGTIVVTEPQKAKQHLDEIVNQLLMLGVVEIRVVDYKAKKGFFYRDGKIYEMQLLPSVKGKGDYEGMTFSADLTRPLAQYLLVE